MQVFLPLPDIYSSVACLDNKRLGKQRVECLQILNALEGLSKGWVNHPATRMFRGYEPVLRVYMAACISEWIKRGFKNTMTSYLYDGSPLDYPSWFGDPAFHASHRSNLLRKDPTWYGQFGWTEPHDLPYVWPVLNQQQEKLNV